MLYSFIIRRAETKDTPHVHEILQKAFREYAQAAQLNHVDALDETTQVIEKEIAEKTVYIAEIDSKIVGTVRLEIDKNSNIAYLSRFAVSSVHRNIGIGKAIMNVVDNYLISENIKKVYLFTAAKHNALMRFYYGRGFYAEEITNSRGYLRAKLVKDY